MEKNQKTDMLEYGASPEMLVSREGEILGRVTAVHKERYELITESGACFGRLKKSNYFEGGELFPTVGDFVKLLYNGQGDARIVQTLERKSFFNREDPSSAGHWDQAVAANFDYVFILQSLNSDFNLRRLERYLALVWQSGATPVVVLTKADLVPEHSGEMKRARETAVGADVIAVSAKTGYGIEELREYLKPRKTIVFSGSSGVGKSSLINTLTGKPAMATGDIREATGGGGTRRPADS